MLKKTQTLVIALAVFALFAACQKDELSRLMKTQKYRNCHKIP
jgi:hypothetical protein